MLCGRGLGTTHIHRPLTAYVLGAKIAQISLCSKLSDKYFFRENDLTTSHFAQREKACCIFMRSSWGKKRGGTSRGERVVQTGREVVPLLPWGTTSPCLSQYLSNVGGPTKEYANKYTESRRLQIHVDRVFWFWALPSLNRAETPIYRAFEASEGKRFEPHFTLTLPSLYPHWRLCLKL